MHSQKISLMLLYCKLFNDKIEFERAETHNFWSHEHTNKIFQFSLPPHCSPNTYKCTFGPHTRAFLAVPGIRV